MFKAYLETSFFSECVTERSNQIDVGRRASSLIWWFEQSKNFDLCISGEVVRELSHPDYPLVLKEPALEMLSGLKALDLTVEVAELAPLLVSEKVMPGPSIAGDALHFAACVVHSVDFLVTWNQKHLANPSKRVHLAVICSRLNVVMPTVVTPDLLIMESKDDK